MIAASPESSHFSHDDAELLYQMMETDAAGNVSMDAFLRAFPASRQKRAWGVKLEIGSAIGSKGREILCPICERDTFSEVDFFFSIIDGRPSHFGLTSTTDLRRSERLQQPPLESAQCG